MRAFAKIVMGLAGFVLLLPGLCNLVVIWITVTQSGDPFWVIWAVGFFVSACGAMLIYLAFGKTQ